MFIQRHDTPDGFSDILMCSDGQYLTGLWFENYYDDIKHNKNFKYENLKIFVETRKWLDIYFSGSNPICIIVPCHRVIRSNDSLISYGGGISNKIKFLELENNDVSKFTILKKGKKL